MKSWYISLSQDNKVLRDAVALTKRGRDKTLDLYLEEAKERKGMVIWIHTYENEDLKSKDVYFRGC